MKLKFEFSAEITDDIGDVSHDQLRTEEQLRVVIKDLLREACGPNASILIRDYKLTEIT